MKESCLQGCFCSKAGFTLIELLVVVLIIGILAAVAVPQYQVAVTKSRYATLKNLVESIVKAEEIYYLANETYTTDMEQLDISFPATNSKVGVGTSLASYLYDWGQCVIQRHSDQSMVSCTNKHINMTYQHYLKHSKNYKNKRLCLALDTLDISLVRNKVCRLETSNLSYPSGSNTGWWYK